MAMDVEVLEGEGFTAKHEVEGENTKLLPQPVEEKTSCIKKE